MHIGHRIARHNAAALHWSPSFILGAMLSKVVSHQRLERPNAVSHLPWTLLHAATRICYQTGSPRCDQCTSRNSARCCASPMRDCTPNIAQCIHSNPPAQAIVIVHFRGKEASSMLPQLQCTLLCAAICPLVPKSANRCLHAACTNSEGSTNCMPTPQL